MGWALTLGTKTIQILGSYIRDRREYLVRHPLWSDKGQSLSLVQGNERYPL